MNAESVQAGPTWIRQGGFLDCLQYTFQENGAAVGADGASAGDSVCCLSARQQLPVLRGVHTCSISFAMSQVRARLVLVRIALLSGSSNCGWSELQRLTCISRFLIVVRDCARFTRPNLKPLPRSSRRSRAFPTPTSATSTSITSRPPSATSTLVRGLIFLENSIVFAWVFIRLASAWMCPLRRSPRHVLHGLHCQGQVGCLEQRQGCVPSLFFSTRARFFRMF